MRLSSITYICLFLFTTPSIGQRLYTGQKGLSAAVGVVDQVQLSKTPNSGFYAQVAYSRINENRSRWVFGVQGSEKYYQYQDHLTPVNQYLGDISLYLPVLMNYRKNLSLSFGMGASAGHEKVRGEIISKDTVYVTPSGKFLWGGFVAVEGEVFLTNKVVWFVNLKERLMIGSDLEKVHLNLGMGIKVMLNN